MFYRVRNSDVIFGSFVYLAILFDSVLNSKDCKGCYVISSVVNLGYLHVVGRKSCMVF